MTSTPPTFSEALVTDQSLTLVGMKCKDKVEAISKLASLLQEGGYVKETYLANVLNREKTMPTGLQTQAGGVAIPHTDSEHVVRSAMAIGLFNSPVSFKNMADPDEDVEVKIVFLLAIAEKKSVMVVLSKMAEMFLDPKVLSPILEMKSKCEVATYISNLFNAAS